MATIIKTVKTSGGNYTSLSAAIAGIKAGGDNIAGNTIVIECYAMLDTVGSAWIIASGWNVDAINITVPLAERHTGTRETGYRLEYNVAGAGVIGSLHATIPITVTGVAAKNTNTGTTTAAFEVDAGTIEFIACLAYDVVNTTSGYGFYQKTGNPVVKKINCIALGCGKSGFYTNSGTSYESNCDALNNGIYGFSHGSTGTRLQKNCYAGGNTTADYNGTTTKTTCHSSDATGNTQTSVANCHFANSAAGNENIHIDGTSALFGVGTDLRADAGYNVTLDFEDNIRVATPCIGANEFLSSGHPVASRLRNISRNKYVRL